MAKVSDLIGQPSDAFEQLVLECFRPSGFNDYGAVTIGEFAGRLHPLFNQAVRDAMKSETE